MQAYKQAKFLNAGLLVLRVGIGLFFLGHGVPKLLAGPERWGQLGQAMGLIGITFLPGLWGFMAAISEALGGLLLIAGFLVRPTAALMFATMLLAAVQHLSNGHGFGPFSHPGKMAVVFIALIITGGGAYSIELLLRKNPTQAEPAQVHR